MFECSIVRIGRLVDWDDGGIGHLNAQTAEVCNNPLVAAVATVENPTQERLEPFILGIDPETQEMELEIQHDFELQRAHALQQADSILRERMADSIMQARH